MKKIYLTLSLVVICICGAMAQWSGSGTTQYLNGATNRVGINVGTSPTKELDVNGEFLMRYQGDATKGLYMQGGLMSLRGWGANNPYIEWRTNGASGTRQGYMGWNTDRLSLVLENGYPFTVEGGKTSLGEGYARTWLNVYGTRLAGSSDVTEDQVLLLARRGPSGSGQQEVNMGVFLSKYQGINGNSHSRAEFRLSYEGTVGNNWGESLLQGHTVMTLQGNGNVGIGTRSPAYKLDVNGTMNISNGSLAIGATSINSLKLAVEGKIGAREVVVTAGAWPDYVFKKDYNLPTLEYVKSFIDENSHLPNVPSEQEIEKNGVQLGEMNGVLLRKTEELTLYVLDQNEKIKTLEQTVNELKSGKKKRH